MAELQAKMQALTLDPLQTALITAMNTAIADKNTAIAEKQAAKEKAKAAVDQAIADKKAAVDQAIAGKNAEVHQAIAEKNAAIAEKQAAIAEKKAAVDQAIADKKAAVDQAIADKNAVIAKKDREVEAGIYHHVCTLSLLGSTTNAKLASRLVSQMKGDQRRVLNFSMPDLSPHDSELRRLLSMIDSAVKEEDMHEFIAAFCRQVCDLVGAQVDFNVTAAGSFAPDLVATPKSLRANGPAPGSSKTGSRVSTSIAILGTHSLFMVEGKKHDLVHQACLQLASYLLYFYLTFNDAQIPASVQSWPATLYGMAWVGSIVYVVRVDLKLDGKLIQPAITFCHTEPARAVLFLLRTAIINDMSERSFVGDFDWRYNFNHPPSGQAPPGNDATTQHDPGAGYGTSTDGGQANSLVLNLATGPQPLLDAQEVHRYFMFTGKLSLNASAEFSDVVVKFAPAIGMALTEQLARAGMALALLNRDRMAASAHRIPELLALCTADFNGMPGLALVTGFILGESVDWKQHQPHAASFASQVCDTLRWIHEQGVVHGDIHRGNLLVIEPKLPSTPPASPPKGALEPPPEGAVKLPPHSIALIDFGLACFLPAVTRAHVQAALLAAPVTVAAAQELQPWLDRVEHNAWEMWPNHFYDIARSTKVATPQADFLGLGLLAVSLEVGGTKVLQQQLDLNSNAASTYAARALKRHLLRDQDGLLSQLLEQSPTTLLEVQKIVALADQPQPLL
ncbi:hypothetical protein CAOG_001895 [Capsaspora owczarzaki ATCC 30864]|uniref:Protein kinase domain-containing protein n=1 Tax=Capsaspora owczarzaki (strain ATCC 30864) TaxID=595528 RepID=A0A0D2WK95_CAPO3|nr:hypothetical protein CAOG_001895 [Capsaspora owczarzaki ATCC 30864]